MVRTLIDIDDAALQAVAELLGTRTKRETVNRALRELLSQHGRVRVLQRFLADSDQLTAVIDTYRRSLR